MVGIAGNCLAIEPIGTGGDSVIRLKENLTESVSFPQPEGISETISESVTVVVT